MLVWRLNLAWKRGHPNQCLRLGDDAKTDRTLGARFRESASYGNELSVSSRTPQRKLMRKIARHSKIEIRAIGKSDAGDNNLAVLKCEPKASSMLLKSLTTLSPTPKV